MQNAVGSKKMMAIGEAAKYLGVSRDTLRRWEKAGRLKALRSPTNRRYYTKEILDAAMTGKRVEVTKAEVQKGSVKPADKKRLKIGKTPKLLGIGLASFVLAAILVVLIQFFLL